MHAGGFAVSVPQLATGFHRLPQPIRSDCRFMLARGKFGIVPRYYFDVQDGNTCHIDDVGDVLDGLETALQEAMGLLSELAQQILPNGKDRALVSTVRDEDGKDVYKATLTLTGAKL